MLYLPELKTKIYLIVLCGFILFHVSFLSSKSYTAQIQEYKITNGTEDQYQSCLSPLTFEAKIEFIKNTKVKYLFNLPDQSLLLIYFGYFLIAIVFILSIKFNLNKSENEKK